MALLEDAHAEITEKLSPLNPCLIEITPEGISAIIFGIK